MITTVFTEFQWEPLSRVLNLKYTNVGIYAIFNGNRSLSLK